MVCGVTVEVRVASTSLQTTTISMYIPGSANPYTTYYTFKVNAQVGWQESLNTLRAALMRCVQSRQPRTA